MYKRQLFSYITAMNNWNLKFETQHFILAFKREREKHLGNKLNKVCTRSIWGNYKTLMKKIKRDLNKWEKYSMFTDTKTHCCQDVGSWLVLHNSIYRSSAILIKIPTSYFMNMDKLILKFIAKGKRPIIANTTWNMKNKVGGLKLLDFKTV